MEIAQTDEYKVPPSRESWEWSRASFTAQLSGLALLDIW